jgi:hypothetical protein
MIFKHWIACPAAPFTRLSSADITIIFPVIDAPSDFYRIGMNNVLHIGKPIGAEKPNESVTAIGLRVSLTKLRFVGPAIRMNCRNDASVQGDQVRGELDLGLLTASKRDLLFDLRKVAMKR